MLRLGFVGGRELVDGEKGDWWEEWWLTRMALKWEVVWLVIALIFGGQGA